MKEMSNVPVANMVISFWLKLDGKREITEHQEHVFNLLCNILLSEQ